MILSSEIQSKPAVRLWVPPIWNVYRVLAARPRTDSHHN
jgi:hypothetical protein